MSSSFVVGCLVAFVTFIAASAAASMGLPVISPWTAPIPSDCAFPYTCSWAVARGGNSSKDGFQAVVGLVPGGPSTAAEGYPLSTESTTPPPLWQGGTPFAYTSNASAAGHVAFAGGNIIGVTTILGGSHALQAYAANTENFQPVWTSQPIKSNGYPPFHVYPVGSRPNIVVVVLVASMGQGYEFIVVNAVTGAFLGRTTLPLQGTFQWLDADGDIIVGWLDAHAWHSTSLIGLTIERNFTTTIRFHSRTGPLSMGQPLKAISAFVSNASHVFVVVWVLSGPTPPMSGHDASNGTQLWSSNGVSPVAVVRSLGLLAMTNAYPNLFAMSMRTGKTVWATTGPTITARHICAGETVVGPYVAVATQLSGGRTTSLWIVNATTGGAVGNVLSPGPATALACSTETRSRHAHIAVIVATPQQQQGPVLNVIQYVVGRW